MLEIRQADGFFSYLDCKTRPWKVVSTIKCV